MPKSPANGIANIFPNDILWFKGLSINFAEEKKRGGTMQYWANIGGVQHGPVNKEELAALGISQDSYVWRPGLDEWVLAVDLEELADLFPPTIGRAATEDSEGDTDNLSSQDSEQLPPSIPVETAETYDSRKKISPQVKREEEQTEIEKCPPTNLVWAILSTVMCFTIFGVIAIVYAAKVSSRYRNGDIATAKKFSDRAAMWSILSITIGVVTTPLYYALQLFY